MSMVYHWKKMMSGKGLNRPNLLGYAHRCAYQYVEGSKITYLPTTEDYLPCIGLWWCFLCLKINHGSALWSPRSIPRYLAQDAGLPT
jgi:hypothetical protein